MKKSILVIKGPRQSGRTTALIATAKEYAKLHKALIVCNTDIMARRLRDRFALKDCPNIEIVGCHLRDDLLRLFGKHSPDGIFFDGFGIDAESKIRTMTRGMRAQIWTTELD